MNLMTQDGPNAGEGVIEIPGTKAFPMYCIPSDDQPVRVFRIQGGEFGVTAY